MANRIEINLKPVEHITTDAIGSPGKRVFYIQGSKEEQTVTLIIEKYQIQTLAVGVEQFMAEVHQKYPELEEASSSYQEDLMQIIPPVEPLFRVGEIGLGYDVDNDLIALVAREIISEGRTEEDLGVVRFWCSRSQLRALVNWGLDVASHGRPLCPQCSQPMDEEGHFCPKKNGHKY
jgi:uncharacterized repeat protein (TIGR03847 family)